AGVLMARWVQLELAIVRILVGVLVVPILYLTARRIQAMRPPQTDGKDTFFGLPVGWGAGPLGLPLRFLSVLLLALAVIRFFPDFFALLPGAELADGGVPPDVAFVAFWLMGVGAVGLILGGEVLRLAASALTILISFDLLYAGWSDNLAVVGFWGAFTLLAALAFSYLAAVQGLGGVGKLSEGEEEVEG
ncbi:MAG: hypothetical protein PVG11_03925, partial [Anaerolineae bacterium]